MPRLLSPGRLLWLAAATDDRALYVGWTVPVRRIEPTGPPLGTPLPLTDSALPLGNTLALYVGPVTALNTGSGVVEVVAGLSVAAHLAATPASDTPLGGLDAVAVELPGQTGVWVVSWDAGALDAALTAHLGEVVYAVVRIEGQWRGALPFRVTDSMRAPV